MFGEFDAALRIKAIRAEVLNFIAEHADGRRPLRVYPQDMQEIVVDDGVRIRQVADPEMHVLLVNALGAHLGSHFFLIHDSDWITMEPRPVPRQPKSSLRDEPSADGEGLD